MGCPSESYEAIYRNPINDVKRFLDRYHKNHYKLYNLCSERTYDYSKFEDRDHNCPDIELIEEFVISVQDWLDKDPKHVAVVHCKAGKGRTGLMLSCWMLFQNMWANAKESLDFFGYVRCHDCKGVTIPSQKRFVSYFEKLLLCEAPIPKSRLIIKNLSLHSFPHGTSLNSYIFFKICSTKGDLYISEPMEIKEDHLLSHQLLYDKFPELILIGSVKIICYWKKAKQLPPTQLFHFWFHTSFIENNTLYLSKNHLDKACKDKHHKKFPLQFNLLLSFESMPQKLLPSDLDSIGNIILPKYSPPSLDSDTFTTTSTTPSLFTTTTSTTSSLMSVDNKPRNSPRKSTASVLQEHRKLATKQKTVFQTQRIAENLEDLRSKLISNQFPDSKLEILRILCEKCKDTLSLLLLSLQTFTDIIVTYSSHLSQLQPTVNTNHHNNKTSPFLEKETTPLFIALVLEEIITKILAFYHTAKLCDEFGAMLIIESHVKILKKYFEEFSILFEKPDHVTTTTTTITISPAITTATTMLINSPTTPLADILQTPSSMNNNNNDIGLLGDQHWMDTLENMLDDTEFTENASSVEQLLLISRAIEKLSKSLQQPFLGLRGTVLISTLINNMHKQLLNPEDEVIGMSITEIDQKWEKNQHYSQKSSSEEVEDRIKAIKTTSVKVILQLLDGLHTIFLELEEMQFNKKVFTLPKIVQKLSLQLETWK